MFFLRRLRLSAGGVINRIYLIYIFRYQKLRCYNVQIFERLIMYQKLKTNILVRDKMIEKMESEDILVDYKELNSEDYEKAFYKFC